MSQIKVIHIPYDKGNPYQKLLLENLSSFGVDSKIPEFGGIFHILLNFHKQGWPNILHVHWQHPLILEKGSRFWTAIKSMTFMFELVVLKLMGIKIIWTVHNLKNHENIYHNLEIFFSKLIARFADALIAHCETAKQIIIRYLKVTSTEKIFVIPHGNYLEVYDKSISKGEAKKILNLTTENITFVFFGGIRPYKGVLELIDAFIQLDESSANLVIAGKPIDDTITEQIKSKAKGRSNIHLILRFIPEGELQLFLNSADVMIFPYRDVLTSGAIILAMSFGKAIIAPILGCIGDTLDEIGSFLYNPLDKEGLLKAMSKAIILKNRTNEMGKHNLYLAEKLSWRDIARSTQKVYEHCLGIR